jgi:UDP-N-acetylglucosamine--N-acetylmuramyl-(pentapeptide) pyrophosphoryl-undecaprenol N-acetylglucosamine transferase
MKKILLVGGGSGGHLTPLLAVAEAIKAEDPKTIVQYLGQKQEGLAEVLDTPVIDESFAITAGKFRRYHGTSFWAHLLDVQTLLLNARDFFRFTVGTFQAFRILGAEKPSAIFLKGGFVCVPVGIAARLRRIPYITHDSDAIPGLANRLTAKHAYYNTTALEPSRYPYPEEKTMQVGIPLQKEYQYVSVNSHEKAKKDLGYTHDSFLLVSVGGGLGARRVNQAVVETATKIMSHSKTHIIHLTGKKLYQETIQWYNDSLSKEQLQGVRCIDFSNELYKLTAAADVVILRAGATNIAEMAVQGKACIVVPNPLLTGGQQLHNARVLEEFDAAVIVPEDKLASLVDAVELLRNNIQLRKKYAASMHKLADSDAANKLATLLLELAQE